MRLRDFTRAGHLPTLFCAFLYFDVSFMIWVLLGALANSIVSDYGLSDAQKGFLVAVPILGGAILRIILGLISDQLGARRTAIVGMVLTIVPLLLGWLWVSSYQQMLIIALMLGIAGASFAVALPLASRWYPQQYQGLALGIAGAGNSGTALATFFAPRLAASFGWQAVFGFALLPLICTLIIFAICAKESPSQPVRRPAAEYLTVLKNSDTWWFSLFYSVTFGGFVGLATFLNIYFHDQYGLTKTQAGTFATLCVIAGSFLRPVGGYLADCLGGVRVLILFYFGIGNFLIALAISPSLGAGIALMLATMGLMGMGNGAVFQLVPQRFDKEVGTTTGIVGAAGGIGGFLLPTLLGAIKQTTGSFSGGFLIFGLLSLASSATVVYVSHRWEKQSDESTTLVAPAKLLPNASK